MKRSTWFDLYMLLVGVSFLVLVFGGAMLAGRVWFEHHPNSGIFQSHHVPDCHDDYRSGVASQYQSEADYCRDWKRDDDRNFDRWLRDHPNH